MERRWPNFFVAGVAKCGTTSLYRYLAQHPEIHMSEVKELRFFDNALDEVEAGADEAAKTRAYLSHFEDAGQAPVVGEGSPGYFYHPEAPRRIAERVDDPRFLISFRDPVERAFSDYLMSARMGRFERSFLELVADDIEAMEGEGTPTSVVPQGLYATNLERFFDVFDRERFHIMLLDDLKQDPLGLLEAIARFLDVDPDPMAEIDYEKRHNPYGTPRNAVAGWLRNSEMVEKAARVLLPKRVRIFLGDEVLLEAEDKPEMDPEAREVLEELYAPEVDRLEAMLDRELPELRRSWIHEG